MPIWIYHFSPLAIAIIMQALILGISLVGLFIARHFLLHYYKFHDGVNDAISGTVQAIGVFYGVTVGLISVGVWNTNSNAADLVDKEATSIASLYRDVRSFPEPKRTKLCNELRDFTREIIEVDWPLQRKSGKVSNGGAKYLDTFQNELMTYEPVSEGDKARYSEALASYNRMIGQRRLRLNAVNGGLSDIMWVVIWVGAGISIGVAYLFHLEDPKLHATLVALIASFLGLVLFMIVLNDRPFFGTVSVSPQAYQSVMEALMQDPTSP